MDARILGAVRLMERNIGEDVQIDAVASAVDLSLHHFHRLFVSETNETPAAFLRRIRMNEAVFRLKWADEATGEIAHAVGFRSRPAFARAFERQFGVTPAAYRKSFRGEAMTLRDHAGFPVFMRELPAMQILSRRYIGDIFRMRTYWEDFCARLPELGESARSKLYVGQIYDDPRITPPDKVRYDCGIVLDVESFPLGRERIPPELELIETYPGTYASIRHIGHYSSIPDTYDVLCHKLVIPIGRVPAAAPALEIHTAPRHLQDPECVDVTIMMPVE